MPSPHRLRPDRVCIERGWCGHPALGFAIAVALLTVRPVVATTAQVIDPQIADSVVCYYDFEHPVVGDPTQEADQGASGTAIWLVNGGPAMRVGDGAYPGSATSIQAQQVNPTLAGNDDWKAGIYNATGVSSLHRFSAVSGITLMGWVKPTGTNPNLNSNTSSSTDTYNGIGLFGVLSGTSDGHAVRALVEVLTVNGAVRLVGLGRRIDSGSSLTLAASDDWQALLPTGVWTHLAATFDFDTATICLYRNGEPLAATYSTGGDPWVVVGGAEPDVTSAADPAGIKIGGSYPQNTLETNAFNGRLDDLMFCDRVLTAAEVQAQYERFLAAEPAALPGLRASVADGQVRLVWPSPAAGFVLETTGDLQTGVWQPVAAIPGDDGQSRAVQVPYDGSLRFFRLHRP